MTLGLALATKWNAIPLAPLPGSPDPDAVLDAFNDSDLGLGGTNLEGYTLGFNLGLARQTMLGVRYLAGRTIDSPLNNLTNAQSKAKYQVNTLQVDLNVRF